MGTWTIYTAGADVTLLQAILNGVAMISAQSSFVWGFALLASMWSLLSGTTSATLAAAGGGSGSILANSAMGALMPLVLAMLLTSSGAQCTVQVESVLNGRVTQVDNVPFVIAVIPAAASQLCVTANGLVSTAFSSVNPSYDSISATGNGFLDPMKRLLGARTAILRLGGIDSEIHSVVSACLAKESGVNYAEVNQLVVDAGNTGAAGAQTVDINGTSTTAIGALLFQAAQNATGFVPDIISPTQPQTILSCADAVAQVQSDIDDALNSAEFARVIQGAVNGMDQPNPDATYGIDKLNSEFGGLRKWSSVTNTLAGGQTQANAEVINILFAEMVTSSLNCLQADGPDRASCQSAMAQATEIERANIQAAANEVPMLKYAGLFGAYLLALIIGLGPIIVMFMMFAGTNLKTCIATVVHIMVWPILVMNVGAEIVNAMVSMQFSNFVATVAQSGYLSQAVMLTLYKELSLQVGSGSHMMASLPVLMSMIFALGSTSALVHVADGGAPKGKDVGESQAPSPSVAAPLVRNTSPVTSTQGAGFAVVQSAGAMNAVSSTQQFAAMAREGSRAISESESYTKTISEGQTNAKDWARSFDTRDYSVFDISQSEGEAFRMATESRMAKLHSERVSKDAGDVKQNTNTSNAAVSGGAGLKIGSTGISGGVDIGARGSTSTGATDSKQVTRTGSRADAAEFAEALNATLSSELGQSIARKHGTDRSQSFRQSQAKSSNYQHLLSHADAQTNSAQEVLRVGSTLVGAFNKMGAEEIAQQSGTNAEYQRLQLDAGRRRDVDRSTQKYRQLAEQEMRSGATDSTAGSQSAREAVLRTRAAALQAGDASATEGERFGAIKFLSDSAKAMTHLGVEGVSDADVRRRDLQLGEPVDKTGVEARTDPNRQSSQRPKAAPRGHNATSQRNPGAGGAISRAPRVDAPANSLGGNPATGSTAATSGVADKVDAMFADADRSGLGGKGRGTVIRVGQNIADNVADVNRPVGSPSRVSFGEDRPSKPRSRGGASGEW